MGINDQTDAAVAAFHAMCNSHRCTKSSYHLGGGPIVRELLLHTTRGAVKMTLVRFSESKHLLSLYGNERTIEWNVTEPVYQSLTYAWDHKKVRLVWLSLSELQAEC